jgi:hypothetical protein
MKRTIFAVLLMTTAVAGNAYAWTYVEIDKQGHERYLDRSPIDLTYPPDNVPTPMVYADDHSPPRGTPITAYEERQRRNADTLLIIDGPLLPNYRDGWLFNKPEHALH